MRTGTAALPLLLCGCALAACAPATRHRPAPVELAPRLVLALDGVDYRDVMAARARGLFREFQQPSRLISTFPSISDISWHDIFGVVPPPGYQRVYYSRAANRIEGKPLDAIRPIEYEHRMDLAFGGRFHHLGAYVISFKVATREVDAVADDFFSIRGRSTVYAYNVGPDALQHTRGDVNAYLDVLDARLVALRAEYRRRTGNELEVVLLSDHGHNRAADARILPLAEHLEAAGFRVARRIETPKDVVLSVDGVTTGLGIFCDTSAVDRLAVVLARIDGVDVVSSLLPDGRVRVRSHSTATALIERSGSDDAPRFRYVRETGDPLGYGRIVDSLSARGALDAQGFASASDWFAATVTHQYPAALQRIVRGHTEVTLNPAPILVSLTDAQRVSNGMTSVANRLRPLGGTHGALSATNSVGIVMSTARATHDDATQTVRVQFGGFEDLIDFAGARPGARVRTMELLRRDRLSSFVAASSNGDAERAGLEIWLGNLKAREDSSLGIAVELRHWDAARQSEVVAVHRSRATSWMRAGRAPHYFLSFHDIGVNSLLPDTEYVIKVTVGTLRQGTTERLGSQRLVAQFTAQTNFAGKFIAF